MADSGETFVVVVEPLNNPSARLEVPASADAPVGLLKEAISANLGVPREALKLVYQGVELLDDSTLAEYQVASGEVVRAVVVGSAAVPGAVAASPPSAAPAAAGGPESDGPQEGDFVAETEIPRAVIVTGIPAADTSTTQKALLDVFLAYGTVERVIIQSDAADSTKQHAILVFSRETGAASALAFNLHHVLGGQVSVFLASTLASGGAKAGQEEVGGAGGADVKGEGGAGAGGGGGGVARTASAQARVAAGATAVGALMATGYLAGKRGVAFVGRSEAARRVSEVVARASAAALGAVADLDRRHHVSERVTAAARDIDERLHVSERAAVVAARASASAREIDERFRVSERASQLAERASQGVSTVRDRALENERVRQGVSVVGGWLSAAASAVDQTIARTREEIARREAIDGPQATPPGADSPLFDTEPSAAASSASASSSAPSLDVAIDGLPPADAAAATSRASVE
jgi:hypothetical protein